MGGELDAHNSTYVESRLARAAVKARSIGVDVGGGETETEAVIHVGSIAVTAGVQRQAYYIICVVNISINITYQ